MLKGQLRDYQLTVCPLLPRNPVESNAAITLLVRNT